MAPFPVPAHQTGHALLTHPAFRLASPQGTRQTAILTDASRMHPKPPRLRPEVKLSPEIPNFSRRFQAHRQSPRLLSFESAPEVRGLPSILFPGFQRYYAPLRLPPGPAPEALLQVATLHPGRVSRVAQDTFPTCHPHYPGGSESVHASIASSSRIGLPRILGGSASTTFLSGPAQGSRSLRPARLLQPYGLHLSPELQQEGLPVPLSG
jgi:hypothetical protein